MECIFHEKQEGQLCAQHALNCLLQDQYFTAVDLATLASELDEQERRQMEEGGRDTEEYRKFVAGGSSNMDDSGFFSVQVIQKALSVWALELLPYQSQNPICDAARANPTLQKAYICNLQEHWFTLRKIGQQWFNLNSLLSGPELISDTYLSLFLTQLQNDGYSIFVVNGILPDCRADQILANKRVTQTQKPRLLSETKKSEFRGLDGFTDEERNQMQSTIAASLADQEEIERRQLEAAMALSMQPNTSHVQSSAADAEMSEEEQLKAALKMSLEQ